MKKYMLDMKVTENCSLHKNYCLLKLTSDQILPEMLPGQFVQVRVDNSPTTFLRRPISINYVDRATNELWLLVQLVGDGTRRMAEYKPGDVVNIMLPLGNGFTLPADKEQKLLLIGGCRDSPDVVFGIHPEKSRLRTYVPFGSPFKGRCVTIGTVRTVWNSLCYNRRRLIGRKGICDQPFHLERCTFRPDLHLWT